jgi:AcrR family transcriptional regulator
MASAAKRSPKPRRGRPTQPELEKRKARVVQVAEDLFMMHGYAGTSVSEISKRSRVSPRLITAHFGGKSAIFTQVINQRSLRASQLAEETSAAETLEGVLLGAAKFAWTTAYSPGAISFLRLVVGEGERFENHTAEIARNSSHYFYGSMERIFIDLRRRGLIDVDDTALTAKMFIDLVIGYSPLQAAMGYWGRVPDDAETQAKVRLFAEAIAAQGQSKARTRKLAAAG